MGRFFGVRGEVKGVMGGRISGWALFLLSWAPADPARRRGGAECMEAPTPGPSTPSEPAKQRMGPSTSHCAAQRGARRGGGRGAAQMRPPNAPNAPTLQRLASSVHTRPPSGDSSRARSSSLSMTPLLGERGGSEGGGGGDGRRGLSARLPIPRRATAACHPRPRHPLPLHMQPPTPWTAHPSTSAAAKRARRPSYVASASGVQASTDGTQSGWEEGGAWGKRMRGY